MWPAQRFFFYVQNKQKVPELRVAAEQVLTGAREERNNKGKKCSRKLWCSSLHWFYHTWNTQNQHGHPQTHSRFIPNNETDHKRTGDSWWWIAVHPSIWHQRIFFSPSLVVVSRYRGWNDSNRVNQESGHISTCPNGIPGLQELTNQRLCILWTV